MKRMIWLLTAAMALCASGCASVSDSFSTLMAQSHREFAAAQPCRANYCPDMYEHPTGQRIVWRNVYSMCGYTAANDWDKAVRKGQDAVSEKLHQWAQGGVCEATANQPAPIRDPFAKAVTGVPSEVARREYAAVSESAKVAGTDAANRGVAVVVGVEHYRMFEDVPFSIASANDVLKALRTQLRVETNKELSLFDQSATSEAIRVALKAAAAKDLSGKRLVFYFSGHGREQKHEGRASGKQELLAYDSGQADGDGITVQEVVKALERSNAAGIEIYIDACNKESGPSIAHMKGTAFARLKHEQDLTIGSRTAVYMSSASGQFSNWYPAKKRRLFTFFLVQGMNSGLNRLGDMKAFVSKNVQDASIDMGEEFFQAPIAYGDDDARLW